MTAPTNNRAASSPRAARQRAKKLAAVVAVVCACTPLAARAQQGGWEPRSQGHRLGGEIDMWPARDFFLTTLAFVGQIEATRHVMIDFALPVAVASRNAGFVLGNIIGGAHYGANVSNNVALWGGGTLNIPTIWNPGRRYLTTAVLAGSSRAFIDLDRFVPETLALHPKGGVEVSAGRIFFYRGEIGTPIFIPLDGGDGDFIFDTAHEFEVRVGPGIGGGGRLSLFADAGHAGDPGDHFQSAIEPYFVYEPFGRKGFFVRAGILLALDRPLGFAFDRNGLAAFRVAAGGKF